jgi:hypothetical protein
MWDSYVDLVGDALTGPLGTFGPSGPFGLLGLFAPHPLEWAKFGSPPSTGNAGRDANLLDNYRRGGWVTKTIALAAPIGAEGLLDSGLAATNRLSALGGGGGLGGLGGELGDLGEVTQPLPSELPNSLADEARSGINWNPLRGRPLSDFLPQSGTPRVRVGGFDQGKPSSVDFLGLRGDNGGRIWVSTSPINATHVETLANGVRNGPLSSGKPIEIISGVHGGPPGFLSPEFDFLVQDYGVLPGEQDVNIHNIASMSDAELAKVLESGNEVILAWCDSDLTRRIQEVMGFNFRAAPF